jgi:hypothetical protein
MEPAASCPNGLDAGALERDSIYGYPTYTASGTTNGISAQARSVARIRTDRSALDPLTEFSHQRRACRSRNQCFGHADE